METYSEKRETYLKTILSGIPNEDFEIKKVFGSDSSSGVAIVRNNKLAGRIEDIKFLESVEPNLREQFLKEGKVLSAMQHGNIPRIYDILVHNDVLLFRSEHIEGYSLKEAIQALKNRKKVFPKNAATSIILKLMRALYYSHNEVVYDGKKESIIHCDIKPTNIILSAKNYKRKNEIDEAFLELVSQNKVEPYLIDFGIARFKGKAIDNSGTLPYLSPVQAGYGGGVYAVDWRTDTYQLLLVYYELLTGKKPYSGHTRSEVLDLKILHDFEILDREKTPKPVRSLIEKGTKRNPKESLASEKECLKELSKIESRQKKIMFVKNHRKPMIATVLLLMIILFSFAAYDIWDYRTQSTDAIIRKIENNPNPSLEELEFALKKVQKRAFEKKYYEPLLKGEFRHKETAAPLYPSHLDAKGNWVLEGPNTEAAGAFVGLLFNYADEYPELLDYAIEYADPILQGEFDGTSERRFQWVLIAAYEKTRDERYLNRLINISDIFLSAFEIRKGVILRTDVYYGELFLWLYHQTNEKKYLDVFEDFMMRYIDNNIDADGYVYEHSMINFISPYGSIPNTKSNRLVTEIKTHAIGRYLETSNSNLDNTTFKSITSTFSRDFVQVLLGLNDLYEITNDTVYKNAIDRTTNYYIERLPEDKTDFLFVSYLNQENNIPKDTLATIKSIQFFKISDKERYYEKLISLITSKNFRKEEENGIISNSVLINNNKYDHSDETLKDQSLIVADSLFLKIK